MRAGFEKLYPVNPKNTEIQGRPCFADIESVPESVDLVLLAIGADDVLPYLERCHALRDQGSHRIRGRLCRDQRGTRA